MRRERKKNGLNKKPHALYSRAHHLDYFYRYFWLKFIRPFCIHVHVLTGSAISYFFSTVGRSTVWSAVLWRGTNCIFIRNGAIHPTWLWTPMPHSISITIRWIYFLGNSNAIFTAVVRRCYQNVDLKYNLSKWKYISDKVRVRHLPTFYIDSAAPQTSSIFCPISIPSWRQ